MLLRCTVTLLLMVLLGLLCQIQCISFTLKPEERRCLREEVHKDVLVVGEYRLSDVIGQKTDLLVSLGGCKVCE